MNPLLPSSTEPTSALAAALAPLRAFGQAFGYLGRVILTEFQNFGHSIASATSGVAKTLVAGFISLNSALGPGGQMIARGLKGILTSFEEIRSAFLNAARRIPQPQIVGRGVAAALKRGAQRLGRFTGNFGREFRRLIPRTRPLPGLGAHLGRTARRAVDRLRPVAQRVGGAFKGVGALAAGFAGATAAMVSLGHAAKYFVELANPGAVFQFTLALRDLMAVVGRALNPILDGTTVGLRAIADGLIVIEPVTKALSAGLGRLVATLGEALGQIVVAFAPILQLFTSTLLSAIELLCRGWKMVGQALTSLLNTLVDVINWVIRHTPGVSNRHQLDKFNYKPGASVGAAIGRTQYSSIEEVGRRTSLEALRVSATSVISASAKYTGAKLDEIRDILRGMATKSGASQAMPAWVRNTLLPGI